MRIFLLDPLSRWPDTWGPLSGLTSSPGTYSWTPGATGSQKDPAAGQDPLLPTQSGHPHESEDPPTSQG
jgi:hypothetical protein